LIGGDRERDTIAPAPHTPERRRRFRQKARAIIEGRLTKGVDQNVLLVLAEHASHLGAAEPIAGFVAVGGDVGDHSVLGHAVEQRVHVVHVERVGAGQNAHGV
jgi:hypothetical protein